MGAATAAPSSKSSAPSATIANSSKNVCAGSSMVSACGQLVAEGSVVQPHTVPHRAESSPHEAGSAEGQPFGRQALAKAAPLAVPAPSTQCSPGAQRSHGLTPAQF